MNSSQETSNADVRTTAPKPKWEGFFALNRDERRKVNALQLKAQKSCSKPSHASTSTAKPIHGKKLMLCIWWDKLGVLYYELLQSNKVSHWSSNSPNMPKDMTKSFSTTTLGLMWQKSSKTLWRRFNEMSCLTRRIHQIWPGRATLHFLRRSQKLDRFLVRLIKRKIFWTRNLYTAWKTGKNDWQYFE